MPDTNPSTGGSYANKERWLSINPQLHIEDEEFISTFSDPVEIPEKEIELFKQKLSEEGCLSANIDGGLPVKLMSEAATRLVNLKIPSLMCYLYDEFWIIHNKYAKILHAILGDNIKRSLRLGMLYISPDNKNEKLVLKPHRDRGIKSIDEKGLPKSISVWIPLTDTYKATECNYILPKNADPYYNNPESDPFIDLKYNKPNNNITAVTNNIGLHNIRSLPVEAGGLILLDQNVLNWMGTSNTNSPTSTISVLQTIYREDINPEEPFIDLDVIPDFKSRLELIRTYLILPSVRDKTITHHFLAELFDKQ